MLLVMCLTPTLANIIKWSEVCQIKRELRPLRQNKNDTFKAFCHPIKQSNCAAEPCCERNILANVVSHAFLMHSTNLHAVSSINSMYCACVWYSKHSWEPWGRARDLTVGTWFNQCREFRAGLCGWVTGETGAMPQKSLTWPQSKFKRWKILSSVNSTWSLANNELIQNDPSTGIKCTLFERPDENDPSAIIHNSQSLQDNSSRISTQKWVLTLHVWE